MPTLQLRCTPLFWFQGAWELGQVFGGELFCFCLFVCFSTPKVGDYFVFKSHKWVRFSSFFLFLFLFCFVLFCFVLFFVFVCFFVLFCVVLFFLQNVQFPHHISRVRLIFFFFFFFFFLSRWLVKFFAFFYFCLFVFILFCFVLFLLPKIPPPWYQMVRPYPYSITQMMVDTTSSTILNSHAIQWKI